MTRPPVLRALLALLILGLSAFYAFTQEPRLGLDLRGGTSIVLETQDSPTTQADAEATDRALEVLRRRVDALGVAEPTLARSGENRIIVELPGVQDSAAAAEAIGQTAQLTFHPVLGPGDPTPGRRSAAGGRAGARCSPRCRRPARAVRGPVRRRHAGAVGAAERRAVAGPGRPRAAGRRPRSAPRAVDRAQRRTQRRTHALGRRGAAPEVGEDAEFDPSSRADGPSTRAASRSALGPAALTGEDVGDAAATVDQQTGTSAASSHRLPGRGRPQVGAADRRGGLQPAG